MIIKVPQSHSHQPGNKNQVWRNSRLNPKIRKEYSDWHIFFTNAYLRHPTCCSLNTRHWHIYYLQSANPNQVNFHTLLNLCVSFLSLLPKVHQIRHHWPWVNHHWPVEKLGFSQYNIFCHHTKSKVQKFHFNEFSPLIVHLLNLDQHPSEGAHKVLLLLQQPPTES